MPSPCLEILNLLSPSGIDPRTIAPGEFDVPRITSPVVKGSAEYKKGFVSAIRNGDHRTTSSRGGRKPARVSPQDVSAALAGIDDLQMLFVLQLIGQISDVSRDLFVAETNHVGLKLVNGHRKCPSYSAIAPDDFAAPFWAAWTAYNAELRTISVNRVAELCSCSWDKAKLLRPCVRETLSLFQEIDSEICRHLQWQLFERFVNVA